MVNLDGGCKRVSTNTVPSVNHHKSLSEELLQFPFAGCELLFVT
jgi:hypothetical protein